MAISFRSVQNLFLALVYSFFLSRRGPSLLTKVFVQTGLAHHRCHCRSGLVLDHCHGVAPIGKSGFLEINGLFRDLAVVHFSAPFI
jgi:hypothetical protein